MQDNLERSNKSFQRQVSHIRGESVGIQGKGLMMKYDLFPNEFDLLRKDLAALQKHKRGLMQKLLTGTWGV